MQYHEAPASFNVKFIVGGYECQFTVRGEEAYPVLEKGLKVLTHLRTIEAEPRIRTAPAQLPLLGQSAKEKGGNGEGSQASAATAVKVILCSTCGIEAPLVTGVSQKNGRAYHAHKCPQCREFVKDTFRWDS